jgi:predicted small integral membrane protein
MTSFTPARFADHEDVRGLGPVLRGAASVLVLMTAAYYLLVAFDNITNPASNWAFVHGVLSEDGVVPDSGFQWRAIDATWFQVAGYVVTILVETLTGAVLLYVGTRGLRSLRGAALGLPLNAGRSWVRPRGWQFFPGFITVGGNWFVMYLNSKFNGLDPAFRVT